MERSFEKRKALFLQFNSGALPTASTDANSLPFLLMGYITAGRTQPKTASSVFTEDH